MSEAEQSVNVEDVLSSIRRLVADGSRIAPEHPKPTLAAEPEPAQTTKVVNEPEVPEPTPQDSVQPASFVDTMNASIAEITEPTDEGHVNEVPVSEAEARVAHVDAFLANETAPVIETATDKPEPFVLRPEMVAELEIAEPVTNTDFESKDIQSNTNDAEDAYEISFHDTLEDDETIESDTSDTEVAPEAPIFDEETLREIVSELVRSELQGDLGDRITRNVRKLVRREIHHALATRDFE